MPIVRHSIIASCAVSRQSWTASVPLRRSAVTRGWSGRSSRCSQCPRPTRRRSGESGSGSWR